jgi:hypothetical protein
MLTKTDDILEDLFVRQCVIKIDFQFIIFFKGYISNKRWGESVEDEIPLI